MTSAHRAALRRAARLAARGHDGWEGFVVGWCDADEGPDYETALKGTHDALIKLMGTERVGGVGWQVVGLPQANDVLDTLTEGTETQELLDHYRHLRALLREHGGYLVIARAPGIRPRG